MQINEIEQNPVLLKLHKHGITGVNAKNLIAVLDSLDGWSVAPSKVWIPFSDFHYDKKKLFPIFAHNTEGVGMPDLRFYNDRDKGNGHFIASTRQHRNTLVKAVEELKQGSRNLRLDVSEIKTDKTDPDFAGARWSIEIYVERLAKALEITSPNGESFDLVMKNRGHDLPDFYEWAESTDFFSQIANILGMNVWVNPADREYVYTREGVIVGHCAICGREQATKKGKMVRHGYQRPGVGYLVGMCFGAYEDAYEISPDACKKWIPELRRVIDTAQERLDGIENGNIVPVYQEKHGRQERIVQGDHQYKKYLDMETRSLETAIKYASSDIERMETKIANWKKGELRTVGKMG